MTPAARVAAAIEVLDLIFEGSTPEKALTGWGRSHRFAGSKDRAAIRDHVFQALRCRASYGWVGGANTGRGVMLGAMRMAGHEGEVFTGTGHAPEPVEPHEAGAALSDAPRDIRLDCPAWLLAHFEGAFGAETDAILDVLRSRAGVFLRVNTARTSVADAIDILAKDDIAARPVDNIKSALQVIENERRVALSEAYLSGLVELQDSSSQAAVASLGDLSGQRVLDLCAGGGGKSLALAASGAQVTAHDIDPRRMADLGPRAARAQVEIATVHTDDLATLGPFDLVFCDAPCSGSGTWRRAPGAKWELTPQRLDDLIQLQRDVLTQAAALTRPGGRLVYATCSVFAGENTDQSQWLSASNPLFLLYSETVTAPHAVGDGFYTAVFARSR